MKGKLPNRLRLSRIQRGSAFNPIRVLLADNRIINQNPENALCSSLLESFSGTREHKIAGFLYKKTNRKSEDIL